MTDQQVEVPAEAKSAALETLRAKSHLRQDQRLFAALQAAAPSIRAQFEAEINEEAADFDAELEDFASALTPGGPRPDYMAIAERLNQIACELSALAPSKLDSIRDQATQQERERVREALKEQAEEYRREAHEARQRGDQGGWGKLSAAQSVVACVTRIIFDTDPPALTTLNEETH